MRDNRDVFAAYPKDVERSSELLDLVAETVVGEMDLLLVFLIHIQILVAEKRGGGLHHIAKILYFPRWFALERFHLAAPSIMLISE